MNKVQTLYHKRESIDQNKLDRIKKLTKELNSAKQSLQQQYEIQQKLFEEYLPFRGVEAIETATVLLQLAKQVGDSTAIKSAQLNSVEAFFSSGLLVEATEVLSTISPCLSSKKLKARYFILQMGISTQLGAQNKVAYYNKKYNESVTQSLDSVLYYLPQESEQHLLFSLHKLNMVGKPEEAMSLAARSSHSKNIKGRQAAMMYSYLAWSAELLDLEEKQIEYLLQSIESDIKSSTYETISARVLAQLLSAKGEVELAQDFILFALNDAQNYGAQQRIVEISQLVPLIENQVSSRIKQESRTALIIALLLFFSLLSIATLFVRLLGRKKEIEKAKMNIEQMNQTLQIRNKELQEANEIKLDYLTSYFETSSLTILQLEKFQEKMKNLLIQKRYQEMERYLIEENLTNKRELIYEQFDRVFLNLFPSFVRDIQELISESTEEAIENSTTLTAELRVYALQRLGIQSPQRIASILGVSRNTIYAYRNRIKTKTKLSTEDLDDFIQKIPLK